MVYHYCHVLFSSYFHVTFINSLELTWSELVLAVPFFQLLFWIASFLPCDWYLSSLQFMFDKYELGIELYCIIELWQWNLIGDDFCCACFMYNSYLVSLCSFPGWAIFGFGYELWSVFEYFSVLRSRVKLQDGDCVVALAQGHDIIPLMLIYWSADCWGEVFFWPWLEVSFINFNLSATCMILI